MLASVHTYVPGVMETKPRARSCALSDILISLLLSMACPRCLHTIRCAQVGIREAGCDTMRRAAGGGGGADAGGPGPLRAAGSEQQPVGVRQPAVEPGVRRARRRRAARRAQHATLQTPGAGQPSTGRGPVQSSTRGDPPGRLARRCDLLYACQATALHLVATDCVLELPSLAAHPPAPASDGLAGSKPYAM